VTLIIWFISDIFVLDCWSSKWPVIYSI